MTGNRFAGTWLGKIPVPLPADFVQGIDTQRYDFKRGLPSYLRGQWADHGWWYYYLYALAIKEPLGTWCLAALAIGATMLDIAGWLSESQDRTALTPSPSPAECGASAGHREICSASWRDEVLVLAPD